MSDDSDHFADGLTEELLNLLAKNDDLKVAGRTSSFAFKGRNEDLREIGVALGVAKVLEGSVRRSGENIRVTAQLINVADGFHIWSDTYDRELADIFEIQDEVAGAITQALELHLTPAAERLTDSPEAYAAYLEAVSMAAFNKESDVADGIAALNRATALDPEFAKAYELRSWYYWMNAGWYVSNDVGQARVHEDATKALEIDPELPGAKALAVSSHPTTWDWIIEMETLDALVEVDRSIRVLDSYSWDLVVTGYLSEAEAIHREILARDPLSYNSWYRLAEILYAQRRDAEAREAGQKASELGSDFWNQGHSIVFHAELAAGNYETAASVIVPRYDEEWFQAPDFETFSAKMSDPETGRDNLIEWVDYRIKNDYDGSGAAFANNYYLFFGHLDLYADVIDHYSVDSSAWTDAEAMQAWGIYLPGKGYRKSQHFLERAEKDGLIDLWEHRGPPDFCSKETGEWVCW
jgi:TolB-like protein